MREGAWTSKAPLHTERSGELSEVPAGRAARRAFPSGLTNRVFSLAPTYPSHTLSLSLPHLLARPPLPLALLVLLSRRTSRRTVETRSPVRCNPCTQVHPLSEWAIATRKSAIAGAAAEIREESPRSAVHWSLTRSFTKDETGNFEIRTRSVAIAVNDRHRRAVMMPLAEVASHFSPRLPVGDPECDFVPPSSWRKLSSRTR